MKYYIYYLVMEDIGEVRVNRHRLSGKRTVKALERYAIGVIAFTP